MKKARTPGAALGLLLLIGLGFALVFAGLVYLLTEVCLLEFWIQTLALAGGFLFLALGLFFSARGLFRPSGRGNQTLEYHDFADIETLQTALMSTLRRDELSAILTQQAPALLHLDQAHFWYGEPSNAPTRHVSAGGLQFPLKYQGKVRALWSLGARRDGKLFNDAQQHILELLASQAEAALRNVLLVEALRRQLNEIYTSRDMLAQMQHQLLRSRESERSRLARDMHDGPLQTLVALNLELGLLSEREPQLEDSMLPLRAELRGLITEMRQVCADLRPPLLDTLGLTAALKALILGWMKDTGIQTTLTIPEEAELNDLSDEIEVNLYRIVQEALQNISKHAAAEHVILTLKALPDSFTLTIKDDGKGFTSPDTFHDLTQQGHFGLASMRERVVLIGGEWDLKAEPGKGTRVQVTLPRGGN